MTRDEWEREVERDAERANDVHICGSYPVLCAERQELDRIKQRFSVYGPRMVLELLAEVRDLRRPQTID